MTPSDRKALEALVAWGKELRIDGGYYHRNTSVREAEEECKTIIAVFPIIERLLRDDVVMVPRKEILIWADCLDAMARGAGGWDWEAIHETMITFAQDEPQPGKSK